MKKKLTLRDVPKEYFGIFRTMKEDKGTFWVSILGMLPLTVLCLGAGGDEDGVGRIVSLVLLCLYLLQIFPAVFYSFENNVTRFRKGHIICSVVSMEIFYLFISNMFYGANAMYIDGLYNNVSGEAVTYLIAGLIFLQHIIMLLLFWNRIKKRIIIGCYLPGGPGFWSKKLLPKIVLVSAVLPPAAMLAMSLSRGALFCSGSVTLTKPGYIFVAFVLFLLAELLSAVFAYGNAVLLARYSYVRIHGDDEEAADSEAAPEETVKEK